VVLVDKISFSDSYILSTFRISMYILPFLSWL